jgi:hypothetical protein
LEGLIEILESLNRKERFFLVGAALGNKDFRLGDEYAQELSDLFDLAVPSNSWVAMDYHLDWISTALHVTHNQLSHGDPWLNDGIVKGNQEDVDLIVGFERAGTTVLLLLEAKAATGWTNSQQQSKADRLSGIFGAEADSYPGVEPHFALTSPRRPKRLDPSHWPSWMKAPDGSPIWFPLNVPPNWRQVVRCDQEGQRSATGGSAVIRPA